ncbi:60S ribosome subunit biogenesis protein NIP7-like family protein [Opisthorchis viverrini]|uniref:60S ribosome subunit biogenesis protein NIP7 homolog n=1 Tax=Opisthorchis viverrini TaxID=6198 RepID=A0A1S8WW08_OPIVI|nr:60S ribosome subunit biogenesis protein NIP7-like family protein [Opisthorchis viverrini]
MYQFFLIEMTEATHSCYTEIVFFMPSMLYFPLNFCDFRASLAKHAATITRKHLLSFGTCIGRFSKTGKFRIHVTALDFLAPYAKHRVWVKTPAEQQFLYGQHVLKSGLARISEDTPQYSGVVVMNMNDVPIGFGVAAKSTLQTKNTDPMTIVVFHQADLGEYIRSEDSLI